MIAANLPEHLRPFSSKANGRFTRQPRNRAPCCAKCGTRYQAKSTRKQITWYYPACECAERGGIPRLRPSRS